MADFLLDENVIVVCSHPPPVGAQATPDVANQQRQRVKVGGKKIVTERSSRYTIKDCKNPLLTGGPCKGVEWKIVATRVKASGEAVLLRNSQAITTPPLASVIIGLTQTRVKGT